MFNHWKDGYIWKLLLIYFRERSLVVNGREHENKLRKIRVDERVAVFWYHKAANQGQVSAQINLGMCYVQGNGVVKNDGLAVKWFRKAANQGYVNGQFNLGLCYENGKGDIKDEHLALEWYRKAAEQGHKASKEALKRLESPCSAAQP